MLQISEILEFIDNPVSLNAISLHPKSAIGNYINFISKNKINEYACNLEKEGTLRYCTIANITQFLLSISKTPRKAVYIPKLMHDFEIAINAQFGDFLENFFNKDFWLSNSKSILNYQRAWELDKDIFLGEPTLHVSPRGVMNSTELDDSEKVKDYLMGLFAVIASGKIIRELNLADSSEDKIEKLLPKQDTNYPVTWIVKL